MTETGEKTSRRHSFECQQHESRPEVPHSKSNFSV